MIKKTKPKQPLKDKPKKLVLKEESRLKEFGPLLFILPLVFLAFSPILNNALTNWDDQSLIIENPLIRKLSWENIKTIFTTFYFGNYQPLHLVSYSIEYHFWQLNGKGYHAVSLFLFLITTSLVYHLFYILGNKNKTLAVIATLLFSINAMRVESIAWAAERKDTLYSLFYVAALITYVNYVLFEKKNSKTNYKLIVYTFIFFTFSIFSKVMAVSIVGAMIMVDYFYQRKLSLKLILEKLPFIVLSIIVGLTQVKAVASTNTIDTSDLFTFSDRLLIVSRNLMFYFYKMLIPVNLSAFYPYPPKSANTFWPAEFYVAPIFLLIALAIIIWSAKHTRIMLFSAGIFVASLALVLQYVAIGPTMFNERYSLIPAISLSFAIASLCVYLLDKYPSGKQLILGSAGVYIVIMFYLTFVRCDVWQNSLTLWNDVLKQFPTQATALNNRGKYYGKDYGTQFAGRDDKTFQAYLDTALMDFNAAILYEPTYELTYNNRGIVYSIKGKTDLALKDFDKAIALNPKHFEAIINRGITLLQNGNPQKALADFNTGLSIEKTDDGYTNRGSCYLQLNQLDSALNDFNAALAITPNKPEVYFRRSEVFYKKQMFREALSDVQLARNNGVNVPDNYYKQLEDAVK